MTSEELCALIDQFGPVGKEAVSLKEALGRITAEEITSPHDLPEFNRATMDGYAVRARDSFGAAEAVPALFSVVGEVHMGAPAGVDVGV
ncbi:MAG: molybdopterin molybdenumtransferase MoeA, partial [Deltaproteobacteria bacterium]|nr:molybdopterin molybdenumtransferase MoeA [Deltaproteobacteria bacterium]